MNDFQVDIGGKIVTPSVNTIEKQETMSDNNGQHNFDTCKNRSDTEVTETMRTCCKTFTAKAWKCHARNIFNLTVNHCLGCGYYAAKEAAPEQPPAESPA